jgi:tetratricopeptide (TPR) repeat protein
VRAAGHARTRVTTRAASFTVVVIAGMLATTNLLAQSQAERAWLDSLRSRLAAETDSVALARLEGEKVAVARVQRDSALLHMELGLINHRLGELTGVRRRYEDAASEFQWAADLRPAWPWAWYGLGAAELAVGESRDYAIESIRQAMGVDFLSRAAVAFARAVEADPTFTRALLDLATTTLRQRGGPRLAVAQRAVRLASGTAAGEDLTVMLLRGRIERRLEAHDSALAAFRRYLRSGGDPGTALVEIARTQVFRGRVPAARAAYDSALALPFTDAARSEIRRDLKWIASPAELAAYDAAPADSVGMVVREFWAARDARAGRRSGERFAEQVRRYEYAAQHFALLTRRRARDPTFVLRDTSQSEVDDRGVIYLRHGEPDDRARYQFTGTRPDDTVEPNESWLYRRQAPQEDLVFHFVAFDDVQDYRLVTTLAEVLGAGAAVTLEGQMDPSAGGRALVSELYASRARFGRLYEMVSRGGSTGRSRLLAEERQQGQRGVREGLTTDSYALRFAQELRPVVSWFAAADAAFEPELHVVFAIPAQRLHPVASDGGATYPLNLRLIVMDTGDRPLATVDTLRVFRARQVLGEGSYLTEQLVVRVRPGTWRATFVAAEAHESAGSSVTGVAIEVPRMSGGFSASDVVLGREGSGLLWRRPEGDVALNPLMRYERGGIVTLYYEVYGLDQGATVDTRVRVLQRGGRSLFRRLFGGGGGADLEYATVTDAPGRARVRQQLGLEDLGAGRYQLEVTLTDRASGARLVRTAPFEVENRRAP